MRLLSVLGNTQYRTVTENPGGGQRKQSDSASRIVYKFHHLNCSKYRKGRLARNIAMQFNHPSYLFPECCTSTVSRPKRGLHEMLSAPPSLPSKQDPDRAKRFCTLQDHSMQPSRMCAASPVVKPLFSQVGTHESAKPPVYVSTGVYGHVLRF